ncbi:MAG: zinc ribbon domain-containing protein [Anaerolineales bacterium]|nr:zinc ribbon domain-containing protein [Anaerolineales bacterium]
MILGNKRTCPQCGHKASRAAQFCPSCGARMGGGVRACGACGTQNRGDAQFCKQCGRPLERTEAPEIRRHRWSRREDDFATRVDAGDLPGLLKRGLIIDPGTNAILIEKGTNRGTVPPGEYTLDTIGGLVRDWISGGVSEGATALLVEITPTEFEFHMGGIFTNDPLRIGVSIKMQAQVEQPGKFLFNMLKGRARLTKEDLRQHLYPEVSQVARRWVRQHSVQELADDINLKDRFELALEETLRDTFAQNGLRFLNVRVLELNLEHLDRITGIRSQYALQVSEAEAEAEGKKRLVDAQRELDLAELAEETQKVEMEERRAELYQRMREAVMSDRMNEVYSTAEFEAFLDDIDQDKLLREKERADMLRTWKEEAEDQEKARAHLLAKLEIERNYELRAAELKQRTDLDEKALDAELRLERMRATKQQEIEYAKWEFTLRRRRSEVEFEREQAGAELRQEELAHQARLAMSGDAADEELRQMDAELDLGLKGLRGIKQVRAEADQAKWELERQKLEFEWEKQQHQLDLELQRERIQMEHELNRLDKLGDLGADALIAASDTEQARLLTDLKKAEALQGMSEDQILAAAAKDSPEVARAFQEKFRAIAEGKASEREREMYEKLLAEKDARERATIEAWDKASARAKETTERALDRMADTAQAFARGQGGTPVVITQGTGGPQVISPSGVQADQKQSEGMKMCPKCGRFVDEEAHHCEHCGNKFEGV